MNWLGGARSILFMTCREAAPLISQRMDRPLARVDGTAVRLHLAVCASCRRYRGQLGFLRRLLEQIGRAEPAPTAAARLSVEARARIGVKLAQGEQPRG